MMQQRHLASRISCRLPAALPARALLQALLLLLVQQVNNLHLTRSGMQAGWCKCIMRA